MKRSDAIGPPLFNHYRFRMNAGTLSVTTAGPEAGPARNPTTVRYVRSR